MELYNLMEKLPYIIMLFTALAFIYMLFFGGLGNLAKEVEEIQEDSFRRAVVLENLLSVKRSQQTPTVGPATVNEIDERRAILHEDFFTVRDPIAGEPGYRVRNGHCYIPRVAGLDGQDFGFNVKILGDPANPPDLGCTTLDRPTGSMISPALLIGPSVTSNDKPRRTPVRLFVYKIEEN